ncbi:MAG: SpoIVB peptidase [Clostridiales bacterium]|nr:SpoIVB peptidase [Clostridiales bacterium]
MYKFSKSSLFYICLIVLLIGSLGVSYSIYSMPDNIDIFENETRSFHVNFPFEASFNDESKEIIKYTNKSNTLSQSLNISPLQLGNSQIDIKLFGKIPVKEISVNIVPDCQVIPGGHSIGVKMNIKGVLVVGMEEIETSDGTRINPSLESGLQIGDVILSINGINVNDAVHVQNIINDSMDEVKIKVKRKEEILNFSVRPVYSKIDEKYRIGLWVRDKTAGVGTLTYYNTQNKTFGALGHAITDIDTGIILNVNNGEILNSKVLSVQHGKSGYPGEIKGIFYEADKPIGALKANTQFGIFGEIYNGINNPMFSEAIPIGYQNDIKKGKAYILTTLEENKIEKFEIYIEKINYQTRPNTKSMVIRVTDDRLLKKSGGIVQGMSGSPILQDGKLIGAVTHVFVNDPSKGYAIFIEWMLRTCEQYNSDNQPVNN